MHNVIATKHTNYAPASVTVDTKPTDQHF